MKNSLTIVEMMFAGLMWIVGGIGRKRKVFMLGRRSFKDRKKVARVGKKLEAAEEAKVTRYSEKHFQQDLYFIRYTTIYVLLSAYKYTMFSSNWRNQRGGIIKSDSLRTPLWLDVFNGFLVDYWRLFWITRLFYESFGAVTIFPGFLRIFQDFPMNPLHSA